jgi:hypothetical protein
MGWNWLSFPFLYWFLVPLFFFFFFFCLVAEKMGESDGKENQIVELDPGEVRWFAGWWVRRK